VPAKRHYERRVYGRELALEIRRAGRNLRRFGIAVARRAALDYVGDENLLALPANCLEQLVEQPTGGTDKWSALLVLVEARTLAYEHDLGVGVALTGHGIRSLNVERTEPADGNFSGYLVESSPALILIHSA
jgi:hypothetical protein